MKKVEDVAESRGQNPDLTKLGDEIAKDLGGPGLVASYENHSCAFCAKIVDVEKEFKDALSRKDWDITRLCQKCQDDVYKEPDE